MSRHHRRGCRCALVAAAIGSSACGPVLAQTVYYVDADVATSGNGTSWGQAYKYLADALGENFQDNDEVWVAEGTYYPDQDDQNPSGTGDPEATFLIPATIKVYGGFAATESNKNDRDIVENPTTLSGDLGTDHAYHVVTISDAPDYLITPWIDGFIIEDGDADGQFPDEQDGGAMYIDGLEAAVLRCDFRNNSADDDGGGIYANIAPMNIPDPDIFNCTFLDNDATNDGGGAHSAGPRSRIVNCLFAQNTAGGDGGGLFLERGSTRGLTNCTFSDNTATGDGGALLLDASSIAVATEIKNSIFWDNSSEIDVFGTVTLTLNDCDYEGGWTGQGTGNIDDDPFFRDPTNDDYRLCFDSPCIDVGDATDFPEDVYDLHQDGLEIVGDTPDLDDGTRVLGCDIEMGAYEDTCTADFDGDGDVDVDDLVQLLSEWNCSNSCTADANCDGLSNVDDLLLVLDQYGLCPGAGSCNGPLAPDSLEDVIEDACLTWPDDWDDFVDIMTTGTSSEKTNAACWLEHYLTDCHCECKETHSPATCPSSDPFGGH